MVITWIIYFHSFSQLKGKTCLTGSQVEKRRKREEERKERTNELLRRPTIPRHSEVGTASFHAILTPVFLMCEPSTSYSPGDFFPSFLLTSWLELCGVVVLRWRRQPPPPEGFAGKNIPNATSRSEVGYSNTTWRDHVPHAPSPAHYE